MLIVSVTTVGNQVQPWWQALGRAGVQRKLWLTQAGHVDPFDLRRGEWVRTPHRWFDSELYGVPNGIRAEPPVTREATPGVVVQETAWPAPAAGGVRLALGGPLARDIRLSGTAEVTLMARVDRPTTPLTALLVDYGPARRIGPNEGIRTLDTESCWGAATATDNGCYLETVQITRRTDVTVLTRGPADAAHHRSILRRDPLRNGLDYTLRWSLLPQDVTVHRGHQLGLVGAATGPDMMLADETSSVTVSVRLAGSSVTLPVVDGSAALRVEPTDRVPVVRAELREAADD